MAAGAFAFVAQGADKGNALAALLPVDKFGDFFLHHRFGFSGGLLAGVFAALDDVHHVVDGVEVGVVQFGDFSFDVARNGQIKQEHGHTVALFQCAFDHAFADERKLAGGGRDDDVVLVQDGGQFAQQARFGVEAELVAQFLRTRQGAVGDGNQFGVFGGEVGGDQLDHFAGTDE